MSAVLEVEQLNVRFPLASGVLHAVRDVSFRVEPKEILAIVGESGCGKSMTALAIMNLLYKRAERRVEALRFRGEDIARLPQRKFNRLRGDRMAMIFQEPMTSLNPVYTIGDQLEEVFLRHRDATREDAGRRARSLLEKVGIPAPDQRMRQYPHQLSGGLRQRVMIAMALMCEPDLIIADEPTTALDVTIQAQVLALLKRLQAEFEMAMILITHDLGVVARMADRVLVMYAGEIVESGPTRLIFDSPSHPYTQGLLRCLPQLSAADGADGRLGTIAGVVPSLVGEVRGCAFANRCPHVVDACRADRVAVAAAAAEHSYRCLIPPERTLANVHETAR